MSHSYIPTFVKHMRPSSSSLSIFSCSSPLFYSRITLSRSALFLYYLSYSLYYSMNAIQLLASCLFLFSIISQYALLFILSTFILPIYSHSFHFLSFLTHFHIFALFTLSIFIFLMNHILSFIPILSFFIAKSKVLHVLFPYFSHSFCYLSHIVSNSALNLYSVLTKANIFITIPLALSIRFFIRICVQNILNYSLIFCLGHHGHHFHCEIFPTKKQAHKDSCGDPHN